MPQPDTIVTTGEAAKIMGVSTPTVLRRVKSGALPNVGKLPGPRGPYLIRLADIYDFLRVAS